jgi:ubiquinone/menaquinone biosynthesis C-methylase UbiE
MAPVPSHGKHGNPPDLKRLMRRQLAKTRARWQQPDRVLRALRVRRGAVVADVGSGPGYFTARLARAVGPRGRVYAVDPEAEVLKVLVRRLDGRANVTPVLSRDDDPMLPPASCELALFVNAYHHVANPPAFLRRLARCLKPGGRVAAIDWAYRETPVGPPLHRRIPPEKLERLARRAGLRPVTRHEFLPYQYFVVLARPR